MQKFLTADWTSLVSIGILLVFILTMTLLLRRSGSRMSRYEVRAEESLALQRRTLAVLEQILEEQRRRGGGPTP